VSNTVSEALAGIESASRVTMRRKLLLLFALYLAQAIPSGFFGTALPVVMRKSGGSLASIGLVYILLLPWGLKFLWAPYVDRYGSRRFGHYTSWIVPLQIASVLVTLAIATIDPVKQLTTLFALGALFSILASTQDIGADALAVRLLTREERAAGSSAVMIGGLSGGLIGGGALLMVYDRFGWERAVWIVAAAMLVPLLFLIGFREPAQVPEGENGQRPGMRSLIEFVRRPGMVAWLLMICFFSFGALLIQTMIRPFLVDLGIGTSEIGTLLGVVDPIFTGLGLLFVPLLLRRIRDHTSAFVVMALANCATLAVYIPIAMKLLPREAVYGVVAAESFTTGILGALIYTLTLDRCNQRTAGTDFTMQNALFTLGRALPRVLSGTIAGRIGYAAHFSGGAVLYLIGILVSGRALRRK
jgi:MFS transporter, PAT family, beta-lactamase induction signal transducer AmpG